MDQIWIVHQDSDPSYALLGVFDSEDEAYAYQDELADQFEDGVLLTVLPVPWRRRQGTEVSIG